MVFCFYIKYQLVMILPEVSTRIEKEVVTEQFIAISQRRRRRASHEQKTRIGHQIGF